jgi:hypothetical protein
VIQALVLPDWDIPLPQDDEFSWVQDEVALKACYDKIYQEEQDKLLLEWQREKEARAVGSTSLRSPSLFTPGSCLEPAGPPAVLKPAEPLAVLEPIKPLANMEPVEPLIVIEQAEPLEPLSK